MAQSRYLFALSCFLMALSGDLREMKTDKLLKEAGDALSPGNESGIEVILSYIAPIKYGEYF